ncbi:hypothetical protein Tco_1077806 [Tanacetum coccineum]
MEEGVLEQWVLGWVLLSVLHVERGMWKDGRERVSHASATFTCAPRVWDLCVNSGWNGLIWLFVSKAINTGILAGHGPYIWQSKQRCFDALGFDFSLELTFLACDDDDFLFTVHNLPTPVSWLGSHIESVIAAMAGVC